MLLLLLEKNERDEVDDENNRYDECSGHENGLLVGVGFLRVVQDDVVREHGAEAEELGVERRHDGRQNSGRDKSYDKRVRDEFSDHHGEDDGRVGACWDLSGGPDSDEDAGNPDDGDTDGVGDDGELEALCALGSEPVLEEVGEHADAERDEHVGEKGELGDAYFSIDRSDLVAVFRLFNGLGNSAEFI